MPHTLRLAATVALLLACAAPAVAGFTVPIDRPPVDKLAPSENCPYEQARTVLQYGQMTFVADVPRTGNTWRFLVKWKGDIDTVTVNVFNCHVDVIAYRVGNRQPWCAYMPGPQISCPLTNAQ